ncbi:hypothetical protein EsH8_XV_000014 [Colletotrichum jinshuiense]
MLSPAPPPMNHLHDASLHHPRPDHPQVVSEPFPTRATMSRHLQNRREALLDDDSDDLADVSGSEPDLDPEDPHASLAVPSLAVPSRTAPRWRRPAVLLVLVIVAAVVLNSFIRPGPPLRLASSPFNLAVVVQPYTRLVRLLDLCRLGQILR